MQQDLFTYKDRVLSPNEVKKFYEELATEGFYKNSISASAGIGWIIYNNKNNSFLKYIPNLKSDGSKKTRKLTCGAVEEIRGILELKKTHDKLFSKEEKILTRQDCIERLIKAGIKSPAPSLVYIIMYLKFIDNNPLFKDYNYGKIGIRKDKLTQEQISYIINSSDSDLNFFYSEGTKYNNKKLYQSPTSYDDELKKLEAQEKEIAYRKELILLNKKYGK